MTLKLVPEGDKREIRLRGPNITPGYLNRPDVTTAFDEEGFYRTGDAVVFVDATDPDQGLMFDGRIAEDFKLSTGTWVSVGTLRTGLISAAGGLLTDAVLCGENGESVSAMVWLHPDHAHRCLDGVPDDGLRADLEATLERLAAEGGGASQRVDRLLVLTEPAGLDTGEITDKGYVEPTGGARAAGRRGHRPLTSSHRPAASYRAFRPHRPDEPPHRPDSGHGPQGRHPDPALSWSRGTSPPRTLRLTRQPAPTPPGSRAGTHGLSPSVARQHGR